MRICVLAPHSGTTLQAVIDACGSGVLDARVALVISNNSASGALIRAQDANVRCAHLSAVTHPEPAALDVALSGTLSVSSPSCG